MTEVRLIAGLVALIAVVALTGWGIVADFDAGKRAGSDAVTKLWDADRLKIQSAADAQIAAQTKAKEDALAANEVIRSDYETQLLAARSMSDTLSLRLRQYISSHPADPGNVPKASDRPYPTDPGSQAGDVRLTNALGSALAECSANTAQLDALIIEIKSQLK